jgi:hypothetical protein
MEWTWKMGTSMEKTKRIKQNKSKDLINNFTMSHDMSRDMSHDMSRDMSHDMSRDMSHDMSRDMSHDMSRDMSHDMSNKLTFKKDKLREQSNDKLSHRAMIIQRNINPYMINNDYNKDLEIQNKFLIPKDSNDKENDLNN